jgi:hypothetical protein
MGFWLAMISTALAATVGIALLGWPLLTDTPALSLLTRYCALQALVLLTSVAEQKNSRTAAGGGILLSSLMWIALAGVFWLELLPIDAPVLLGLALLMEGGCTILMAKQANRDWRDWLSTNCVEDEGP